MGTLKEGARQVAESCLKVREDERVVLITDGSCATIAEALVKAVQNAGAFVEVFRLEQFGKRPAPFTHELREALERATASIFAAHGVEGELQSFRRPMLEHIESISHLRHAHMINITEEIMCTGMCADYVEMQRRGCILFERVRNIRSACVTTPSGTDLTVHFSPKLRWILSAGDISRPTPKDNWNNLPDGEVWTCPETADGIMVVDGCLGDYFAKRYGALKETPLTVFVGSGRAIGLTCANTKLADEFEAYLSMGPNSSRVGEFAIPLARPWIPDVIGNMLQDEKRDAHCAFGDPYGHSTGADWKSDEHCDGTMLNATIIADNGDVLMRDGELVL